MGGNGNFDGNVDVVVMIPLLCSIKVVRYNAVRRESIDRWYMLCDAVRV